jgi:hypothetical protein
MAAPKNSYLLLLFTFLRLQQAGAQTDSLPTQNWDVYLAKYDKGTGSIMLDMALKNKAPLAKYPFVVVTGVKYTDCNKDGFPSNREFTTLYKISDSVKATIEKVSPAVLAGTFTYLCERLDYFFVSDTSSIRQALLQLYKKQFPLYTFYINIKKDTPWAAYLDFLYPNEETQEYMENQKILLAIQKAGDKLIQPRPVDHWAYFKTDIDRNCFILYAKKNNFTITLKEKTNLPGYPFKLHFTRTDKIDLPSISAITLEIRRQAKKCNGNYDGWETVVRR